MVSWSNHKPKNEKKKQQIQQTGILLPINPSTLNHTKTINDINNGIYKYRKHTQKTTAIHDISHTPFENKKIKKNTVKINQKVNKIKYPIT